MAVKTIAFGQDARDMIKKGVSKLSQAVCCFQKPFSGLDREAARTRAGRISGSPNRKAMLMLGVCVAHSASSLTSASGAILWGDGLSVRLTCPDRRSWRDHEAGGFRYHSGTVLGSRSAADATRSW